ncbi:MAG: 30S ribosomal protein S13 [Desulfurococcales archaeon]|jgi:small subunit ribosomal protein S13|nr:30S ribosomal protein S13 [Desulfurococcales archaeon]
MSEETAFIVRIANTDLPGSLSVPLALSKIKGIGYNTAMAICKSLGIDPRSKLGRLDQKSISRLEEAVKDLTALGFPPWMLNRRKDMETGRDLHLIGSDLLFAVREDIERMKRTKSWKGLRHALGLKVRGQRTVTTGRTGITVGVRKKKEQQQQKK